MPKRKCAVHKAYEGNATRMMPRSACQTCWKIHEEAMNEMLYRMGWKATLTLEPIPSEQMASGTGTYPKSQQKQKMVEVPSGRQAPPVQVPAGGARVETPVGARIENPQNPVVQAPQAQEIEPLPALGMEDVDQTLKAVDDLLADTMRVSQ